MTRFHPLSEELNFIPEGVGRVHLMGVCGTAMGALAAMLSEQGVAVRGSDAAVYPPMSDFLEYRGIPVFSGYDRSNLDWDPDLVVVGNVIRRDNPEIRALAAKNIPYASMPQALARFLIAAGHSLVVCGTHGKTTTSSILAGALFAAGLDPGFMIGGILKEFDSNYRIGSGIHRVLEGDEYDTAFFDKGPKFPHYRPQTAILTSVEFDHADIFPDFAAVKDVFSRLPAIMPPDGLLVVNHDDPVAREIGQGALCDVVSYGLKEGADWRLDRITPTGTGIDFVLAGPEMSIPLSLPMPGIYNAMNAAAVAVVLSNLGLSEEKIAAGISGFAGVKRRQEVRGEAGGVTVIDDFAHHPTAVAATLAGLRDLYRGRRLVAVFEARSNTSRRNVFQDRFARAFDSADLVCVRESEPLRGVEPGELFSARRLVDDLRARGRDAHYFPAAGDIIDFLEKSLVSGDVVAVLSNGAFDDIHNHILSMLRQR